jgi:hypothetical protein
MKAKASLTVLAVILGCAIGGRTIAQISPATRPTQTELIGVWSLVSIETVWTSGKVDTNWMGPKPTGLIIYDKAGYMAAQIMHDPRVTWKFTGNTPPQDAEDASAADKAAAFDGYYAYYGRYEVSEKDHIVRHHIESSLWPPEVGITYERHFELDHDRLTLTTTPRKSKGEQRYNRLVFERVK